MTDRCQNTQCITVCCLWACVVTNQSVSMLTSSTPGSCKMTHSRLYWFRGAFECFSCFMCSFFFLILWLLGRATCYHTESEHHLWVYQLYIQLSVQSLCTTSIRTTDTFIIISLLLPLLLFSCNSHCLQFVISTTARLLVCPGCVRNVV